MFVDTKKECVYKHLFSFYNKYILLPREKHGGENMGRPKGGTNKSWTAQQKFEIIKDIINGLKSCRQVSRETGLANGMIGNWVIKYTTHGLKGLENKRKPGNPLAKYSSRKELSEIEKLEYENLKLRIENERLKKGYTSKEADLAKQKK